MPDNHFHTRIKKLSPLLINQLAAGEVVTRPASVVKELLENAIDAGATHIEVRITQGGMGMIEVVDNGMGIHPDDMVMAITRHATSKIADVANLHGISTLGFRGEALAATAAVSRLTLTSSYDHSGIGRQLQVAGILANTPALIPVVHNRGTTVTVKDLYFNVPARRSNLKSIATEFTHIETIVREVALARADVTLNLFHDNKKRLSLSVNHGTNQTSAKLIDNNRHSRLPLPRLEQALGMLLTDNALEVAIDLSSLLQQAGEQGSQFQLPSSQQPATISGWLWPMQGQQDALPKLLYVNGRLVKEPIISNQLRQLAQSAELQGVGYALYFELPPHWLNINVHPSKQRIKISPLNNVMAHLSHAIRLKLKALDIKPSISKDLAGQKLTNHTFYNNTDYAAHATANYARADKELRFSQQVSRQVQSPKQHYEPAHSKQIASSYDDTGFSETLGFSDALGSSGSPSNFFNETKAPSLEDQTALPHLPYCLDVITDLPEHGLYGHQSSELILQTDLISLSAPPWLLFYYQNQLWLISKDSWQSSLALLFSSSLADQHQVLTSATEVNQQLKRYATQMSAPDLIAFSTDMEALLSKQAIKAIDSTHLVALMLSSSLI